jgi:alpha-1,2-mannosyltransferase
MSTLRLLARKLFDFRDPRVWLFRAYCLWVILAIAASLKTYCLPGLHSVYHYFPEAAQHWWADMNLYGGYYGIEPYRYSPTFAVAATPFGALSHRLGGAIWVLGSVGLLLWALRCLVRHVLPGAWSPGHEAMFLMLALVGTIGGIWSAQSNALILALAIFGTVAIAQQRWWRAAWFLAAPVFIKIWPLVAFLLLVVRWPRQLLGRFTIALLALAAVPFLTRPWSIVLNQYHQWYVTLVGPLQGRWGGYRDAWTIWEHLHPPVDRPLYLALQVLSLAAVFAWGWWQSRRAWTDKSWLTLILGVWSAWQLLFGPGTERLTYGLIAPFLAWAVLVSFRERRLRALSLLAWGLTSLLSMGDFERLLGRAVPHAEIYLPLGLVVFFIWLAGFHGPSPARALATADQPSDVAMSPTPACLQCTG